MNEQEKRDLVMLVAKSHLGRPYLWGGDDPMAGFDCSGFVIECLKSVGILPREGDWTADNLFQKWIDKIRVIPKVGDLVFWTNSSKTKMIHIEIVFDTLFELSIGASGGGSSTVTVQDAIEQNAYIKIRPFRTRSNLRGFINPY